MYLRNYDVRSYSKNLYKAILIDSTEFFLVSLIVWHTILLMLIVFIPASIYFFAVLVILPMFLYIRYINNERQKLAN